MKVTYTTLDGRESTAYLDDEPDEDGVHSGTNKYSDEDLRVLWDGTRWIEQPLDA